MTAKTAKILTRIQTIGLKHYKHCYWYLPEYIQAALDGLQPLGSRWSFPLDIERFTQPFFKEGGPETLDGVYIEKIRLQVKDDALNLTYICRELMAELDKGRGRQGEFTRTVECGHPFSEVYTTLNPMYLFWSRNKKMTPPEVMVVSDNDSEHRITIAEAHNFLEAALEEGYVVTLGKYFIRVTQSNHSEERPSLIIAPEVYNRRHGRKPTANLSHTNTSSLLEKMRR